MRALFLFLIAAVVALGALLVACSGDEEQQQQAQPVQQQTRQTEQSAASQRPAAEQQSQPAQESAEQDGQQAAEQTQAQTDETDDPRAEDPLFDEAQDAFESWTASLESFEVTIDVDLNLGGLSSQVESSILVQLEPFTALTTIDASSLFAMAGDLIEDAADDDQAGLDEPLLMQFLISEDAAYISMPQLAGWIDVSDQFGETLGGLTAMLGASPDDLTNPDQLGQAFACIEALGGSIAEGRHAGQTVWIVECMIDVDQLNSAAEQQLRAQGIDLSDGGIESLRLRLAISQISGAPLVIESHATLSDAFGLSDAQSDDADSEGPEFFVSTVTNLVAWNEPIEFPAPEPLIDGSLLEGLFESVSEATSDGFQADQDPPELLTTEELLELATTWAANADELHVEYVAQAVIDGEARLASTIVRGSRIVGAFETSVNIDEASMFRLLWNRDGIWTSDSEEDGEPIWTPSNPALLGFAGMTVDEFLANPDRLNLDPLQALLGISWATRTIEGGRPPMYELVIESGPLTREDPNFEHVTEILKADTAELLAESVSVDSIEHYSTVITIRGTDGQVAGQVTTAEFHTNAGRVELVANLSLVGVGPIDFSRPMK
jgi:hypothetical protein